MESLENFVAYDHLLHAPLAARGWSVDEIPWREHGVNWDAYEAVIIRTPWDYQSDPDRFLAVLDTVERSTARLENPLELVRWNLHKTYLRDLEARGLPIVPTRWLDRLDAAMLPSLFTALGAEEIVAKPVVGANADDTFRMRRGDPFSAVAEAFSDRACMVQPFVRSVVDEGEFSLFYFGETYSHAILKTPAPLDFRVQEEHGGTIRTVSPEPALRHAADAVMATLTPSPLYARIDFVRLDGAFALMEVELIEPSLYFPYDDTSPERFADAFVRRMAGTP